MDGEAKGMGVRVKLQMRTDTLVEVFKPYDYPVEPLVGFLL